MSKTLEPLPANASLEQAKEHLRANWNDGLECPCCTQMVKKYRRPAHHTMAKLLINLYRLDLQKEDYYHATDIYNIAPTGSYDFAKFAQWKLIEQKVKDKKQKGRTSGYWKITELGKQFVRGEARIPKYVYLFNRKCYGFSEETVDIREVVSNWFDYDQMMKG